MSKKATQFIERARAIQVETVEDAARQQKLLMIPKDNIPRFRAVDVPVSDFPSILWECDAFHRTARQAVDEFAATYWDTPRKALAIDPQGLFRVTGGQRLYQVRLVDNLPAVWRITVGGPE